MTPGSRRRRGGGKSVPPPHHERVRSAPRAHIYIYIYIYVSIYLSIYLGIYVCMYVCMHACMHACMHVWHVCVYVYLSLSLYIYIYIYTYKYMYIYIYIYNYIHTYMRREPWPAAHRRGAREEVRVALGIQAADKELGDGGASVFAVSHVVATSRAPLRVHLCGSPELFACVESGEEVLVSRERFAPLRFVFFQSRRISLGVSMELSHIHVLHIL